MLEASHCTCLPGSKHHKHKGIVCNVYERRFMPATIGEGGLAIAWYRDIDGEKQSVLVPVMEDGRIYLYPWVAMNTPEAVVRCIEQFVTQETCNEYLWPLPLTMEMFEQVRALGQLLDARTDDAIEAGMDAYELARFRRAIGRFLGELEMQALYEEVCFVR